MLSSAQTYRVGPALRGPHNGHEASSFGGGHVGVRSLAAGSALRCPRFVGIHVLLQLESEVDEARMARSQLERSAHVHNTQRYFGIGRRN